MANQNIFYSYDKLISYNAMFNFVIGERGCGKSYGACKLVINDFLKHGREFIYLRRYASELEKSVPKFFDAIKNNGEFEDHEFEVKNVDGMDTFFIDGSKAGYAVSLSTARSLKSTSYPKVYTIIFDEFLLQIDGFHHYLKDEVTQLLDLVETVARLRDIRVLFLGNAISITNPYFDFWKLQLPYGSDFKLYKDGLILVNYIKNLAYRDAKKNTKFGKLIAGTSYGDYAIDNKMLMDDRTFIEKKTKESKSWCTLILNGEKYGVWKDFYTTKVYISEDYQPNDSRVFALTTSDHTSESVYFKAKKNTWMELVIRSFELGVLCFESQSIKNQFMPVITRCMV